MLADIILQIMNRQNIADLISRHEEEKIDYICQDGKITKIIKEDGFV